MVDDENDDDDDDGVENKRNSAHANRGIKSPATVITYARIGNTVCAGCLSAIGQGFRTCWPLAWTEDATGQAQIE